MKLSEAKRRDFWERVEAVVLYVDNLKLIFQNEYDLSAEDCGSWLGKVAENIGALNVLQTEFMSEITKTTSGA